MDREPEFYLEGWTNPVTDPEEEVGETGVASPSLSHWSLGATPPWLWPDPLSPVIFGTEHQVSLPSAISPRTLALPPQVTSPPPPPAIPLPHTSALAQPPTAYRRQADLSRAKERVETAQMSYFGHCPCGKPAAEGNAMKWYAEFGWMHIACAEEDGEQIARPAYGGKTRRKVQTTTGTTNIAQRTRNAEKEKKRKAEEAEKKANSGFACKCGRRDNHDNLIECTAGHWVHFCCVRVEEDDVQKDEYLCPEHRKRDEDEDEEEEDFQKPKGASRKRARGLATPKHKTARPSGPAATSKGRKGARASKPAAKAKGRKRSAPERIEMSGALQI